MIAYFIFTFFPFSTFVIHAYPVVGATSLAPFKSQIVTTLRRDRKPYKQEYMCVIKTGSAQLNPLNQKKKLIVTISDKFYNINNDINNIIVWYLFIQEK